MDLGNLRDLGINSLVASEDRDYGYQVSLDFASGSVNIYQNWTRWPQPQAATCDSNGVCTEPDRIKEGDMPPDSEVVSIADAFLNEMGIDKTGYGTPTVDSSWKLYYAQAESKADYWFPQQLNVQYPLLVDGRYVYYTDGRKEALNVTVDVKYRRAAGVSPIYIQDFAGSDYEAITDSSTVDRNARQGRRPADVRRGRRKQSVGIV